MVKTGSRAPERGDIVWLDFSPQAGTETAGHRPALILSPGAYNRRSGLALACPIRSRAKGYPYEVVLPEGLKTGGVVLSDQIRAVDWAARELRPIETAPPAVVADVTAKAMTLLI